MAIGRESGELCVIGGADVFALTLPIATHLYLTWVETIVEAADVFFPESLDLADWRVVDRAVHGADARHAFAFEFVDYAR
jgi:dihydrofolate reductase